MDDATLHYMLAEETAHFDKVENRRKKAVEMNENRDILAHYDDMQSKSIRVIKTLMSMKYRRECEQM